MRKNVIINNVVLIILISAAMILCLVTSPFAQEEKETYQLESISVIATRTPKVSLDAPASISVITEDEIDAFISEDPFKPLTRAEGIWPRSYRGLADYWTRPVIRGHRALIQVDGVNWNDYGYYSHTGAIPMPDVERIDVVRGPFSALYGSMAQTAVISYTTKIPEDGEVDASASYGDWHSRYYSLRFADRPFDENDSFFYSFSFKSRTSDGYVTTPSYKSLSTPEVSIDPSKVVTGWSKDIDPQTGNERYMIGHQGDNWYEDYGLFLKTGYDFSSHSRLWYSLNVSEFEYGWRDGRSFLKDPSGTTLYDGDVYIQDGGNNYKFTLSPFNFRSDPKIKKSVVHTLHLDHSIPDIVDIVALFAFNDKESATHYISKGRYKVEDNYLAQADVAATFHLLDDNFLVTIGAQGIQEDVTVEDKNLSDQYDEDSTTSIREKTSGKNRILGTFIQAEYSPIDSLTAYLGGRYDHWWGSDADYANIDGEHTEHPDVDDGKFSPKVSLVYHPLENGTIRASYGEAFTAPSLYYRTASYYWESGGSISQASPNPDLKPTTNKSWEIGTEWEFWEKRIRVKATYFENDFADLIVNQSKTSTLPDGTELIEKKRVNAEDAEVNGIEAAVEAILPYNMKAGLFYAHNWSEYTKTVAASKEGWEVDETPTDMWSLWLGYFGKLIDANLSYRYCDSRFDDEKNQYADTTYKGDDDYHVVDAKVTFRPMENVAVSVAVDNLFDEEYYEYYRAPGRYWLGSVSIDF
ncbi:MAG: TonB-dependent receptor [Desulfobacteraceae bacterium]|nr:TonB-dependent receptor [Desulfobacteraceae bacterium]MBC2719206.1 TonB-dependent receptor [Desulfobacteraceae bacterium]